MKNVKTILVAAAVGAAMFMAGRGCTPTGGADEEGGVSVRTDTVVIRDTVHLPVPVAGERLAVRVDTVWVKVAGDTVRVAAELPVERRVYATDHYRAVVEGIRPSLVGMEVYRQTRFIDRVQTVRIPDTRRWGVEVQAGWGFSPKGAVPYVGVGVGYRLIAW